MLIRWRKVKKINWHVCNLILRNTKHQIGQRMLTGWRSVSLNSLGKICTITKLRKPWVYLFLSLYCWSHHDLHSHSENPQNSAKQGLVFQLSWKKEKYLWKETYLHKSVLGVFFFCLQLLVSEWKHFFPQALPHRKAHLKPVSWHQKHT